MRLLAFCFGLWLALPVAATTRVAPSGLLCDLLAYPEKSLITNPRPDFGWIVNSLTPGDSQVAYRIMVATGPSLLQSGKPDMWDSGKTPSAESINVIYAGRPLAANRSYAWTVKTWTKAGGASAWSEAQVFNMADFNAPRKWPGESHWVQLTNEAGAPFWGFENRHPVVYHPVQPVRQIIRTNGLHFFDFGRAAFSNLELELSWQPTTGESKETTVTVHLGEKAIGDAIDRKPGGGVVFRSYPLTIKAGTHSYTLEIPRFVARYPHSQPMPPQMPEVAPFRFAELATGTQPVTVKRVTQRALYYLFNPQASSFSCSDDRLNDIYELCKYSTIANTFNGDYANSERERMMYESDCYIQQQCHYAIDREFAIARYSLENLIYHATWPTEWITHSILMAYADYRHTGNTRAIREHYGALKAKTMLPLETTNTLISTRTGLQTKEFLQSIHFNGKELRDIVDWPHGGMGLVETGGETDNFDFREFNSVVNAFYYRGLVCMAEMAEAVENKADAAFLRQKAAAVKTAFNGCFFDETRGVYLDGIGSDHASLHANLFPLAFGLVPPSRLERVIELVKSRGMACGVYASNYLLEGLFDHDQADYALSLLTSSTDRSWLNMIRVGATMTTEAWDNKYKSNNGWSHAWSASPAHILPRKVLGIEPAEPGFGKVSIHPRPGHLATAEARLPTIRGDILAGFSQVPGKRFELRVTLPANTTADVSLPASTRNFTLTHNGSPVKGSAAQGYVTIQGVPGGTHRFVLVAR